MYFVLLPGVLFGSSALFGVGMVDALGLGDSLLATPLTFLFMALFVVLPYSPLLFDAYAVPWLFRQTGPTLRADARHVYLGDRRFPRETTTVEPRSLAAVTRSPTP